MLDDMELAQPSNILEATKLKRQRVYWREKNIESQAEQVHGLICIGFDGRIDDTKVVETNNVRRTRKQDHYVVISFSDDQYIDHVSPQSAK